MKSIISTAQVKDQMSKKKKLKPFNSVIQVCPVCEKIDVVSGHEKECDPVGEDYRRENQDHWWK